MPHTHNLDEELEPLSKKGRGQLSWEGQEEEVFVRKAVYSRLVPPRQLNKAPTKSKGTKTTLHCVCGISNGRPYTPLLCVSRPLKAHPSIQKACGVCYSYGQRMQQKVTPPPSSTTGPYKKMYCACAYRIHVYVHTHNHTCETEATTATEKGTITAITARV